MEHRTDLKELLEYIDPSRCSYQEWVSIGMALSSMRDTLQKTGKRGACGMPGAIMRESASGSGKASKNSGQAL